MCSTGIGHADCFTSFIEVPHVGHKADDESWTRSKNHVYRARIKNQRVSKKENKEYYQNSTEWHTPATDSERTSRRKL